MLRSCHDDGGSQDLSFVQYARREPTGVSRPNSFVSYGLIVILPCIVRISPVQACSSA
jgi:hypothetical protein